jgi:hypothetical protein
LDRPEQLLSLVIVTLQEVAGAVSHLPGASAGDFQTCSPTQFSGSNLAQVSLPLLKRNQPDALAFEQLLQTGVLVKDLYLSAGQQSDCHVFGLVSPRSPGSSKAWHHKHNQNSHDLPAGTLKNWKHRASPVDVKPVGPGSKPPPANADSFDQPHAVLQVKSEGAVCQPGSCIPLDLSNILGCNWDGGLPQSSAGGAPSALTVELPNSHLPTASTVNPQSLHAEITGVEEVLAEMGVVAGDRGLMSAIVSGQNGLLAAVAAKLAATPATSVEGFCARVQGSQQFSNAAAQGGVTAEAHAAAFPADQPHHHNPAKERQKHMMCLDLRSPCSKVAAAVAAQEKPPEATSSLHHACHAARPTVINHAGLAVSQQQATKLSAPSFGAAALAAAEVVTASCVSACQMVDPQTAAAGTSFVSFKADVTTAQCKNPSSPDTADASKVAINTEVSGSNKAPMPAFVEDHPPAAPLHPDPADISRQHTAGTSVTAADPGRPAAQSSSSMGPRGSPASEAAQLLLGLSAGQQAWMGTARCLPWPPQQQRRRRKLGSATLTDLPTGMISADVQDDLQDTLPVQCAAAKLGSINTSTSYQVAQQRVIAAATSFMHSFESIQPPASISASPPGALSPPCPASGDIHQQQQSLLLPLPLPRLTHLVPEQKNAGVMDPESTGGTQQDVQTAPQASSDPVGGMQDLAAALIAAAAAASVVSSNAAAAPSAAVVPAVLMHPSDNSSQGQKQQLALQQQQPAPLQYQQLTQTDDMLPDQPAAWQPVVRKPKRKAGLAAPAATSAALLPDDVLQFLASQGRGDVDSAGLVRVALGLRPLKDKRSSLSGGGAGASLMPQAYSGQKASAATAMGRGIPAAHSAAAVRTGSSKSANLSKATPGLAGGVSKEAAPSCAVVRKQRPTPAATSTAQDTISNETGATLQDKQLLQAPGVPATGMTWNGHAETAAETADMPFTNESHSADGEGHQGQQQKRKHHSSKQLHSKVQGGPPAAQLVAQASGHGLRSRTGTPASKTAAGLDNCSGKTLSRVLCSAGGRQQATANGCERHPSMTAVSSRTIKRRHSCKVIGSRAVHAAEPSHNTHDSFAPTQQQPQRRHSMPASAAALPAAAADPADLVASFVRAGQLPPRRAAARAAAAVAAAVAASSDADVERLDANDHENQQQIDGTTLGPDCTDFDSDGLACRTQGRGKGRTSASGGAAGSARQKRGKPQLSDGARIKRGRLSSGPAAVAAATATPTAGAGAGAVGAGSYGSSGSGNSGGLGVHDRVLANRLAAARSYLRKKEEIARLEIATGNLQVETDGNCTANCICSNCMRVLQCTRCN